jgi:hypothetical protein
VIRLYEQSPQNRDFHQTLVQLTTRQSGDIDRTRQKGGLNWLYVTLFLTGLASDKLFDDGFVFALQSDCARTGSQKEKSK